jgi:hypothetical protein
VRHAGPGAAVGALDQATRLFQYGRSCEAWALLRAVADAGGPDDDGDETAFVGQATQVATCSVEEGQPWVMLAAQPLVCRWLQDVQYPYDTPEGLTESDYDSEFDYM